MSFSRVGTIGCGIRGLAALGLMLHSAVPATAQMSGQVRYTEVLEHDVRKTIELPGSVRSKMSSVVASEVEGLVVALEARAGNDVAEGQALARLRTSFLELDLRAAEGRLEEARARLSLAESKLQRAERLFEEEVISLDARDDAHSERAAWQGRVDQAQAEIASLKLAIERSVIVAPFSGSVVLERTEIGEWIARGGAVLEMVALDGLEVWLETPERYYDLIDPTAEAVVKFEALPQLEVRGRGVVVVARADPRSRNFPVRLDIPNPDHRIGIGMLADVSLPVGETYRALLVPKDALVGQGTDQIVYRIGADDTVQPVPVESRQGVGSWVVVSGGLTPGDRVVIRGNERLHPGQAVQGERQEYALP